MEKLPLLTKELESWAGSLISPDFLFSPTRAQVRQAREVWRIVREMQGLKGAPPLLSSPKANVKMAKNELPTVGFALAPAGESGVCNTCGSSSAGCRRVCLVNAGRNPLGRNPRVRTARTIFLRAYPTEALTLLAHELRNAEKRYGSMAVRLNVLSDLRWEAILPAEWWADRADQGTIFYDYTKVPFAQRANLPSNYSLTYSACERTTEAQIRHSIELGRNVAIVGDHEKHRIPATYMGYPTIDGDLSDFRPADAPGSIILLAAKGIARGDRSGFVRKVASAT